MAGNSKFHKDVIKPIFKKFDFGSHNEGDFKCLGWNINTDTNGELSISQRDYVESRLKNLDFQKKSERRELIIIYQQPRQRSSDQLLEDSDG